MSRLVRFDAWVQKNFDCAAHALMRRGVSKRRLRMGMNAIVIVGMLVQNAGLLVAGRRNEAMWFCPVILGLSWVAMKEEEADAKAERAGTLSRVDAISDSGFALFSRLFFTLLLVVDILVSAIALPHVKLEVDRLRWLAADVTMAGYWARAYLHRTRPVPPKPRERVFAVQPEGA